MKILGNDILTQQEFDTHMATQFEPHVKHCESAHAQLEAQISAANRKLDGVVTGCAVLAATCFALAVKIFYF